MSEPQDFFIVEYGERWPYSYARTLESAVAKLGALMLEDPRRFASAGLVEVGAHTAERERYYTDQRPQEVTAETFGDMLNCLPPLDWTRDGGVERFNMSEFMDGRVTSQYGRFDGVYLHRYVRHRDASTYLEPLDFQPGRYVPLAAGKEA